MSIIRHLHIFIPIITILFFNTYISGGQTPSAVVSNFNKNDYNMASQNWSMTGTKDGMIHFANNDGLLSFDGTRWFKTECGGPKGMRSLLAGNDGRLYCGGYESFGYMERNNYGEVCYTSLSDRLGDWQMKNDQIWNILELDGGGIFFQSFVTAFIYTPSNGIVRGINLDSFCQSTGKSFDGGIWTSAHRLSRLDTTNGTNIEADGIPFKSRMVATLPSDGFDWIITLKDGIWKWDGESFTAFSTEADDLLRCCNVNKAYSLEGDIIIGSTLHGCMRITPEGKMKWHAEAPYDLQNSTVLGLGSDIDGNVWLALDSGISCIGADNGITCIHSIEPPVGAVYALHNENPYVYLGTNKGLYIAHGDKEGSLHNMSKENKIDGHIWYIKTFDGQTLCGGNGGCYEIRGGGVVRKLCDVEGASCIARGVIHGRDVLVQGTYTRLCIYEKINGSWEFSHIVDGFLEPISGIDIDFRGYIWAAHEQAGLYRIDLNESLTEAASVERFSSLSGEGEDERISVNHIMGRCVFSNGVDSWTYDDMNGRIVPFSALNDALGRFAGARRVIGHHHDRMWLVREGDNALVDFSKPDSIKILTSFPDRIFGGLGVDERKQIVRLDDDIVVLTLDNALGFIDLSHKRTESAEHRICIRSIELRDINGNRRLRQDLAAGKPKFEMKHRLITVDFVCPLFNPMHDIRFLYMLEGRDNLWTELEDREKIEINYLKAGNYTLLIRAVNSAGDVIDTAEYPFRVKPPLYMSIAARIFYNLLFIGLIAIIVRLALRRSKRKADELERKNLEDELKAKSKLIASNTMSLIRKNEILLSIKDELARQKKELGDAYPDRYYRKMVNAIDARISSEEDWNIFQHNFDRIHSGFFHTLRERYPDLTPTDLRFCAFLCLNMTSKEIATMMNISLKGVEAARYRIRKKLGLDSGVSLTDFLMNLH